MKADKFSLDHLGKTTKKAPKKEQDTKPLKPWVREFLKNVDELRKAMDGKKLA